MKNDGGPAYPLPAEWNGPELMTYAQSGMSLRDYFAGQAIREASLGSPDILRDILGKIGDMEELYKAEIKKIAYCAYVMADAMLAERDK